MGKYVNERYGEEKNVNKSLIRVRLLGRAIRSRLNRLVTFSSLISFSAHRQPTYFKMPQPWTDTFVSIFFIRNYHGKHSVASAGPVPAVHVCSFFFRILYLPRHATCTHMKIPISAPLQISAPFFRMRSNAINREQYRHNCVILYVCGVRCRVLFGDFISFPGSLFA